MKPTGDSNPLTLPPALLAEVEAAADEEHRPVADVVRDAMESYLGNHHARLHAAQELERARELGLPDSDGQPTPEYRQAIREKIAQGLASAREGEACGRRGRICPHRSGDGRA